MPFFLFANAEDCPAENPPSPTSPLSNMQFSLSEMPNPATYQLTVSFDVQFTAVHGGEPLPKNGHSIKVRFNNIEVYSAYHDNEHVSFSVTIPSSWYYTFGLENYVNCSARGGNQNWENDGCVVEIDPCNC